MGDQQAAIFAAVKDIFFSAKISATANRLGQRVRFVKDGTTLQQQLKQSPCLLLLDLGDASLHPLELIRELQGSSHEFPVRIVGYLSHVQQELMHKAQEAGCDVVLPRSAFSQNLEEILRQGINAGAVPPSDTESSETK